MARVFVYQWELELSSSPSALWPHVADTDRFNRDTGVPWVERLVEGAGRAGLRRAGEGEVAKGGECSLLARPMRLRWMGLSVEWMEEPFEWVEPGWFSVFRRYTLGPVRCLKARLELEARGVGSLLRYVVEAEAAGALGRVAIPLQVGWLSGRRFRRAFVEADARAAAEVLRGGRVMGKASVAGSGAGSAACAVPAYAGGLGAFRERLVSAGQAAEVVDRLLWAVEEGDELTVGRLRPYVLADEWGVARREVLGVMLHATRAGLLDLRWDLLCPSCRGSKQTAGTLSGLPKGVHCESCHIDFEARFDTLVELTFKPNAAVREAGGVEYCVGGPRLSRHVVAQRIVAGGGRCEVELEVEAGRYRVRTRSGLNPEADRPGPVIDVEAGGAGSIVVEGPGWAGEGGSVGTRARWTLVNSGLVARVFMIERVRWADDAATADQVTSMQSFRDLFSSEVLRPGEQIGVGSLAVLFTDLRGSTRLYREIGDAPAFGRVMSHFDVLREAVAGQGGAVIKTMGDAIMAAFVSPGAAVMAALEAQERLAARGEPMRLKAGVHVGPCIAVTLNERLDYFGTTVNVAARLVSLSEGEGVVASDEVVGDASVLGLVSRGWVEMAPEARVCELRGFEGTAVRAHTLVKGSGCDALGR